MVAPLMPQALVIAGVQHIVSNLSADVESSMSGWEEFHQSLKNIEGLLGMAERRRRLQWTCFRRRFDEHGAHFNHFSASLYEARWHEVVNFLRSLQPLLPVLSLAWDESRYASGTDASGIPLPALRKISHQGIAFSPQKLTTSLRSAFFWRYVDMILTLEEVSHGHE